MPDGGNIQDLLNQLLQELQQYNGGAGSTSSTPYTPPQSEQTWFQPSPTLDKSLTSTVNPKTPRAIPTGSSTVGNAKAFADAAAAGAGGAGANFGEGGGPGGVAAASKIRAQSGYAPGTLAGMMAAAGNAIRAVTAPVNPMGLVGLGMNATGTTPGGFFGHLFNSGMQPVPGQTPFDSDLVNKLSPSYTTADMVRDQAVRNAARGGGGGGGFSRGDNSGSREGGGTDKGNYGGGGMGGHPGI